MSDAVLMERAEAIVAAMGFMRGAQDQIIDVYIMLKGFAAEDGAQ